MADPRLAELRREAVAAREALALAQGDVHLVGIGGVGMAALALQLQARGFRVSGCDVGDSSVTRWLRSRGIEVQQGHDASHLTGREAFVVRSPAVAKEDPEWLRAGALGRRCFIRGVVLPALLAGRTSIAVGGTHGKTTTTAMIVSMLEAAGIHASFCIGGEVGESGVVARVGSAPTLVVEADESDGTLSLYEADYGVITNVEMDHVDFFRDAAELDECFRAFAAQTRVALVYCADDAGASRAARGARRAWGYGFGSDARLQARDVRLAGRGSTCQVFLDGRFQGVLELQVPGRSNVLDALAALAVGLDCGHAFAPLASGLRAFRAVRRRFDVVAVGRGITVVSDYAHHPTEVRALMEQVRGLQPRRVLAVFQPHRYSRTAALGAAFPAAFAGAAMVVLAPVYAASEQPVAGGRIEDLHAHFVRDGAVPSHLTHSLLEAWEHIRNTWREGDVLLVVGAGDVEKIAAWAAQELGGSAVSEG